MIIKVHPHYLELVDDEKTNERESHVSDFSFEFDDEITDEFTKEAYFTKGDNTYKVIIQNDKCNYAPEVIQEIGYVDIGVSAFKVVDNKTIRYNPTPITKYIDEGSMKEAENSEPITPSEMEQFEQQLNEGLDELEEAIASIEADTHYAREMGDYAKGQGDYAKTQGDRAKDTADTYAQTISAMQTDIQTNTTNISTNATNISNLTTRVGQNETDISNINNNLSNYSLITETGSQLTLDLNTSNYKIKAILKDKNGNTIYTSNEIDLPLESVVVSGTYDSVNKKIVLTLEGGSTIDIPVGDLVSGLQSEITSSNKLASDLVDDTSSSNKFVTSAEKTTWNNKSDFSGNYNDLTNKPTIPTQLSQLTDDSTHRLVSDTEKATWNSKIDQTALTDYVKNTDYASSSKGGVVKTGSGLGFSVNNNGVAYASIRTYEEYQSANNSLFISKATLENVITGKDLTTKAYVDSLVGDIESILETIDIGGGINE